MAPTVCPRDEMTRPRTLGMLLLPRDEALTLKPVRARKIVPILPIAKESASYYAPGRLSFTFSHPPLVPDIAYYLPGAIPPFPPRSFLIDLYSRELETNGLRSSYRAFFRFT